MNHLISLVWDRDRIRYGILAVSVVAQAIWVYMLYTKYTGSSWQSDIIPTFSFVIAPIFLTALSRGIKDFLIGLLILIIPIPTLILGIMLCLIGISYLISGTIRETHFMDAFVSYTMLSAILLSLSAPFVLGTFGLRLLFLKLRRAK